MTPEITQALVVLTERRNWLSARIKAKAHVGWDVEWDIRERDALSAVIAHLAPPLSAV